MLSRPTSPEHSNISIEGSVAISQRSAPSMAVMSSQHLHRVAKEMDLLPPASSSSLASSSTSMATITITNLTDRPVTTEEVLEKEAELFSRPQTAMQELEEQQEENCCHRSGPKKCLPRSR